MKHTLDPHMFGHLSLGDAVCKIAGLGYDDVALSPSAKIYPDRIASPSLVHVRLTDTHDHNKSSQLRYLVNPSGSKVRVHQHTDFGQGEINWGVFFKALGDIKFDGVLSNCVFAWQDRVDDSVTFMLAETRRYVTKYWN